jgi:hypothetical protein
LKNRPTFTPLAGKRTLDVEALARLYRRLTGRDPLPEELARAREKIGKAKADGAKG